MAIKAARDRGWESYRSIERYSATADTCRRGQILDHFGDREPGEPPAAAATCAIPTKRSWTRCGRRRRPRGAGGRHAARTLATVRSHRRGRSAAGARPLPWQSGPARRSSRGSSRPCGRGGGSAPRASRPLRWRRTACSRRCCAGARRTSMSCARSGVSGRRSARSTEHPCSRDCRSCDRGACRGRGRCSLDDRAGRQRRLDPLAFALLDAGPVDGVEAEQLRHRLEAVAALLEHVDDVWVGGQRLPARAAAVMGEDDGAPAAPGPAHAARSLPPPAGCSRWDRRPRGSSPGPATLAVSITDWS